MKRNLMLRAAADLRDTCSKLGCDDIYDLQVGAYHLQQALEKTLKQLYIEQGVEVRKTHDIAALLSGLPNWDEYFSEEEFLRLSEKAALITEWEAKTRYADGYLVAHILVESNYKFIKQIFDKIDALLDAQDAANAIGAKPIATLENSTTSSDNSVRRMELQ